MVMGREQGLGTKIFLVADIFNDGPGDGQSVKCGSSASDLIQNQKRSGCRVPKNVRHFIHFDHERRLTAAQIVRSADPGENPVHNAKVRRFCGNKAADLIQKNNQRDLPHIR